MLIQASAFGDDCQAYKNKILQLLARGFLYQRNASHMGIKHAKVDPEVFCIHKDVESALSLEVIERYPYSPIPSAVAAYP